MRRPRYTTFDAGTGRRTIHRSWRAAYRATDAERSPVVTSRSCSWCHAMNDVAECYCRECGHAVGVPRMDCDCPRCEPRVAAEGEPVYCIGKLGQDPASTRLATGQAALVALVPTLPPGGYIITRDGELHGTAEVRDDGTWELRTADFSIGPGYIIV